MFVMDAAVRVRAQLLALAVTAVSLATVSCYPSVDVVWAPDGQRALVKVSGIDNDTMVVDSSGNVISQISFPSEEAVGWMPDSLHLLMKRETPPHGWSDYANLIGPVHARAIIREADTLSGYIRSYHGDWRTFGTYGPVKALRDSWRSDGMTDEQIRYYLAQTHPQVLAPLVKAADAKIKELAHDRGTFPFRMLFEYQRLQPPPVYELVLRDASEPLAGSGQPLIRVPNSLDAALPSPAGRAIAISLGPVFSSESGTLALIPTQPNATPRTIDGEAMPAAWSPDGQDLAYYRPGQEQSHAADIPETFVISRRRVCRMGGDILAAQGDRQDLAAGQEGGWGVLLPSPWLPDGRIIFQSSLLPSNLKEKTNAVFAVRSQPTPIVEQILPPTLWSRLNGDYQTPIVVSQDGKRAALLGRHGAVTVVFLDTGEVRVLQGDIAGVDNDGTVPAWRADGELAYVVGPGDPAGSPDHRELVVDDLQGNKRAISKSWEGVYFRATPPPPPSPSPSAPTAPPH
jgi:hypothetical protein